MHQESFSVLYLGEKQEFVSQSRTQEDGCWIQMAEQSLRSGLMSKVNYHMTALSVHSQWTDWPLWCVQQEAKEVHPTPCKCDTCLDRKTAGLPVQLTNSNMQSR